MYFCVRTHKQIINMKKYLLLITLFFASIILYAQNRPDPQPAPDTYENFKVGMAGYTFVNFDLDKTLDIM